MISTIKSLYDKKPLQFILYLGLFVRLLAAFFSKGYGMTDDHFKIIEEAQNLITGTPSDDWTPMETGNGGKRSLIYPYLHYLLFSFLEYIKIFDPQIKMYVVRILHAFYSLLTIYFSYQITLLLSNKEIAKKVGLIAALFWFLPMLSVRNLVEVVCIPLLMGGTYYALLGHKKLRKDIVFFLAGILLAYAFSVRFQTLAFTGGLGLFFLMNKNWKGTILMTIGFSIPLVLNHYVLESLLFNFPPFGKIINYINFNLTNATTYVTGAWYNFILLFLGIFIPPLSIILAMGVGKVWRKHLILFLPFILFFLFHSVFPGKQERFILPVLMFFPILGLIGYDELKNGEWFKKRKKFFSISWKVFWVINTIVLIPLTFTYSKKSKVEAMYFFADKSKEEKDILIVCGDRFRDIVTIPYYYMKTQKYPDVFFISNNEEFLQFEEIINKYPHVVPDYLLIFSHEEMDDKLSAFKKKFPELEYETTIEGSFLDDFMHWLNPRNRNQDIYIYKCTKEL